MRKIDLTINGRKYFLNQRENELKDDLKLLSASERRYKNFTLYAQKPGFLTKDVMNLLLAKKWKSIKVWSEKFESENQIERFLASITENVENLELRNISLMTSTAGYESSEVFEFKRLKILNLCNVPCTHWLLRSFRNCKVLETLDIENGSGDAVINFLDTFPNVKTLRIMESKLNDEFCLKLSKLKGLKLEEFKIKSFSLKTEEAQKGLKAFFEAQADNIMKLTIDTPLTFEVLQTILQFTKLKALTILTRPDYQKNAMTINRSIADLTINFDCDYELLISLMNSMPKLQIVKIPTELYMKLDFLTDEQRERFANNLLKVVKF